MPRPRKAAHAGLPSHVYLGKGRWFHREPKTGTETWLAKANATHKQIWEAYLKVPPAAPEQAPLTLSRLVTKWYGSLQFRDLAPVTKKDIERALRTVLAFPTASGEPFGDAPIAAITVGSMRQYMDKRGEKSRSRANLELAYLSSCFSWAFQREIAPRNPCLGVDRFKLQARDRYVTDEEYQQRFQLAGELGRVDIQCIMELLYLCRLRENEVLKITDSAAFVTLEGLVARRGKGSKTQTIGWSQRLEDAVNAARAVPRRLPTPFLIVSPFTGRPLTLSAFSSAWQELKIKAGQKGHAIDWHAHDIKAKGVSDFEGDKHEASGHKTLRMTALYDRKPQLVKSTR